MKKAGFIIICLLCVASVAVGKVYWNHKITTAATQAQQQLQGESTNTNVDAAQDTDKPKKQSGDTKTKKAVPKNVKALTADLPKQVSDPIHKAVQDGDTFHLLVVTAAKDPGWLSPLKKQLDKHYGNGLFDVTSESYGHKITSDFLDSGSYKDLFKVPANTDIILMESMMANDQGQLRTDDTLLGTTKLPEAIQKKFPDLTFILQPPSPSYNQPYYADHVDELRQYAKKENILYLNHWKAWPDPASQDITEDLQKDGETPNKKGNHLWGQYLADYFTSQLSGSSD